MVIPLSLKPLGRAHYHLANVFNLLGRNGRRKSSSVAINPIAKWQKKRSASVRDRSIKFSYHFSKFFTPARERAHWVPEAIAAAAAAW